MAVLLLVPHGFVMMMMIRVRQPPLGVQQEALLYRHVIYSCP